MSSQAFRATTRRYSFGSITRHPVRSELSSVSSPPLALRIHGDWVRLGAPDTKKCPWTGTMTMAEIHSSPVRGAPAKCTLPDGRVARNSPAAGRGSCRTGPGPAVPATAARMAAGGRHRAGDLQVNRPCGVLGPCAGWPACTVVSGVAADARS